MADHTSNKNSILIHSTNRRHLLFGTNTLAVVGATMLANPVAALTGSAPVPVSAADDPTCRTLMAARVAKDAVNSYRGGEPTRYERLFNAHITAERALAATPSLSLRGVYGKIKWLAEDQEWEGGNSFYDATLGPPVLRDLYRMTCQKDYQARSVAGGRS